MTKHKSIDSSDWTDIVRILKRLEPDFTATLSLKEQSLIDVVHKYRLPACNDECKSFNQRGLPYDFDTRVIAYISTGTAFLEEDRSLILNAIMSYNPKADQPLEPLTVHVIREFRKALTAPANQLREQIDQLNVRLEVLAKEIENKEDYFRKLINEINFLTGSIQRILDKSTDSVQHSESAVIESFNQGLPNEKIIEIMKDQNRKIIQYFKEESKKATLDALTGLHNRGTLDFHLEKITADCIETGTPLSLMLIDIDFFKNVNDTYGHTVGDQAIKFIVENGINEILKKFQNAFGARYGGEEFVIIFNGLDGRSCKSIAETLRKTIETSTFNFQLNQQNLKHNITVSIGVAQLEKENNDDIFTLADKALYKAKKSGRNRVCYYS